MDKNRVLITGGSRGIGKGLCDAFLSDGYEVLATCRDASQMSSKDKNLIYESLDISNPISLEQFKSVVDDFKPSVLINNAGITKDNLFLRMSDEEWTDVLNTNLTGTFRVTKLVAKLMLKAKWGRIINISSISGIMGNPGQTNYSASKAG
ncbi:MAG: SDR family NAD(P)-dependent oxidoreductase, partial [Proteobacteria bacterium]|nr:SDR family NAD(P)-dependent oxidoreductase [Pseudomonadota bacterium]